MNLGDILKKVAGFSQSPLGEVVKALVPGAAAAGKVIDMIGGATGADANASCDEVTRLVGAMDPQQRMELESQQIELQIVESNNYAAIAIAQEASNNTTRPAIARQMSQLFTRFALLSFLLLAAAMVVDAITVRNGDTAFAFAITMDGLPWLSTAYAVPAVGVIQQYFARRSDDKRTAAGTPQPTGMLARLLGR